MVARKTMDDRLVSAVLFAAALIALVAIAALGPQTPAQPTLQGGPAGQQGAQ